MKIFPQFFCRPGINTPWTPVIDTHHRLTIAPANPRQSMTDPGQIPPDICTLNPDYPYYTIAKYVTPPPPLTQASVTYPECHR